MEDSNFLINESELKFVDYPVGILILFALFCQSLLGHLVGFAYPYFIIGPYVFPRTYWLIFNSFSLILTAFCLWGIYKRKMWVIILITILYSIQLIYQSIHLTLSLTSIDEYLITFKKLLSVFQFTMPDSIFLIYSLGLIFVSVIINIFIIFYVNRKKSFFIK